MIDKKKFLALNKRELTARTAAPKSLVGEIVIDELNFSQTITSRFWQIISGGLEIRYFAPKAKPANEDAGKAIRCNTAHAIFVELVHGEISRDLNLETYDGKLTPAVIEEVKTLVARQIVDLYKLRSNEFIIREFCRDFIDDNGPIFSAANLRQLFNEISSSPDKPNRRERMFDLAERIVDANMALRRDMLDCVERSLLECTTRDVFSSRLFFKGDEALVSRAVSLIKRLSEAIKTESIAGTPALSKAGNALMSFSPSASAARPKAKKHKKPTAGQATQEFSFEGTLSTAGTLTTKGSLGLG